MKKTINQLQTEIDTILSRIPGGVFLAYPAREIADFAWPFAQEIMEIEASGPVTTFESVAENLNSWPMAMQVHICMYVISAISSMFPYEFRVEFRRDFLDAHANSSRLQGWLAKYGIAWDSAIAACVRYLAWHMQRMAGELLTPLELATLRLELVEAALVVEQRENSRLREQLGTPDPTPDAEPGNGGPTITTVAIEAPKPSPKQTQMLQAVMDLVRAFMTGQEPTAEAAALGRRSCRRVLTDLGVSGCGEQLALQASQMRASMERLGLGLKDIEQRTGMSEAAIRHALSDSPRPRIRWSTVTKVAVATDTALFGVPTVMPTASASESARLH